MGFYALLWWSPSNPPPPAKKAMLKVCLRKACWNAIVQSCMLERRKRVSTNIGMP